MRFPRHFLFGQRADRRTQIVRTTAHLLLSGLIATALATVETPAYAASDERPTANASVAAAIAEASERYRIPEHWLRAIMRVESRGVVRAKSGKGAMGLMQIMPATWADLRARHGFGSNPYNLRENVLAGAAYVREMHDRYGAPGFLAAYNAGPGRYEEFLSTGRSLPAETQNYVAMLAPTIGAVDANPLGYALTRLVSWTRAPLFAGHFGDTRIRNGAATDRQHDRRSNARSVVDVSAIVPHSIGLFPKGIRPEGGQ
ncbi:MAG: lytic transglycosylase domain-containing protein [Rhodoblastus sp.]|nr:lytic transglycosylase domain-containing protein [Rhodoblastus sp.]MCC2112522.1 lytic transglycosylase domain-containing protein [Hyphomicrobiales bacterium]